MTTKKRSNRKRNTRTRQRDVVSMLLSCVDGLKPREALQAFLDAAQQLLIAKGSVIDDGVVSLRLGNLRRRTSGGRISVIESDPEIKAFIHSLPGYHSLAEIERLCRKTFPDRRTPSAKGIHRYIQKLTRQGMKGKDDQE